MVMSKTEILEHGKIIAMQEKLIKEIELERVAKVEALVKEMDALRRSLFQMSLPFEARIDELTKNNAELRKRIAEEWGLEEKTIQDKDIKVVLRALKSYAIEDEAKEQSAIDKLLAIGKKDLLTIDCKRPEIKAMAEHGILPEVQVTIKKSIAITGKGESDG